jgi:membrane associated rhomboid family serine protease
MPIRLTPTVKILLFACIGIFLIQNLSRSFLGIELEPLFALVPSSFVVRHWFWQIITYAFLHDPANLFHILLNMMLLVMIGSELEASWGARKFAQFYFFCAFFAGACYLLLQLFVSSGDSLNVPMLGASGAMYGLLIAYGLLFGERTMLFMMLFPLKAKHFIWILAGIEFFTAVFSHRAGWSSFAHLGGMAGGILYLWGMARWSIWKKKQAAGGRKAKLSKKASHLKLVVNRPGGGEGEGSDESGQGPKTWH